MKRGRKARAKPADDDPSDDPPTAHSNPKKRRKSVPTADGEKDGKSNRKVRGKAGRLAFILESPMEIVLEILSYLMPVDILHLSYVDKELRALLTSPTANSVWVAARLNVPKLPECPPDFTERAYARFLFLKTCELCGGIARGLSEMPYIRIRLCGRCHKKNCLNGYRARLCLGRWWDSVDLLPHEPIYGGEGFMHSRRKLSFFKPTADAVYRKMLQINDKEELIAFQEKRREYIRTITDHAQRLDGWLSETRFAAERLTQEARERRLDSIRSRLAELGHDPRDMESHDFIHHRVVAQTAELTDRTWPTARRHLEGIVEKNKDARMQEERLSRNLDVMALLLQSMFEALPPCLEKQTFPPLPDLLRLPTIDSLLKLDLSEEEITSSFCDLLEVIKEDISDFRERMRANLITKWNTRVESGGFEPAYDSDRSSPFSDAGVGAGSTLQSLCRASTVFSCVRAGCRVPLHYSTILSHAAHLPSYSRISDEADGDPSSGVLRKNRWSTFLAYLTVRQQSRTAMGSIIRAAGLDEETATVEDLDSIGAYFYTSRSGKDSEPTTWRGAYRALTVDYAGGLYSYGVDTTDDSMSEDSTSDDSTSDDNTSDDSDDGTSDGSGLESDGSFESFGLDSEFGDLYDLGVVEVKLLPRPSGSR